VQGSPVHNTRALEGLKTLAERGKGKGGREESLKAVRCVVDWWVGGGAPERKLRCVLQPPDEIEDADLGYRYFRDQQLTHPEVTDQYLLLWSFEDWLKKYFFSILQILEVCCCALLQCIIFRERRTYRHCLLILSRMFAPNP
jgi:ribosome biogenesis protein MAK21